MNLLEIYASRTPTCDYEGPASPFSSHLQRPTFEKQPQRNERVSEQGQQRNQENIKVGHDIPIRDMFVAVEKSSDIQMPASIRDVLSRYDELNLRRVHVV